MAIQDPNEVSESSEKLWRERFDVLIGRDELRALTEPSLSDTLAYSAIVWIEVIGLLVGANLLPRLPLSWAIMFGTVIVVLLGLRMNSFGVILHEGSHGCLAKSRPLNDKLTNWLAAFWTINSVEEYRPTHRLHHRYLGQDRDPDRTFYLVPARHGALTFMVLQDLLGVTAFRRATTRIAGTSTESGAPASLLARPQLLVGKAVTQIVILGQFLLFQGVLRGMLFYAVFWLIPIVCLFPMIVRLKTITEHYDEALRRDEMVQWTARSSCASWLQNHLIGARMEYHFEHHVLPTIPFKGLKQLHEDLEAKGVFAPPNDLQSGGYVKFLTHAVVTSVTVRRAQAKESASVR